jgi:hypothetical protein
MGNLKLLHADDYPFPACISDMEKAVKPVSLL